MAQVSGLEFAKAIQERRYPAGLPPWVEHLRVHEDNPIEVVEVGRIVTAWTPARHFTMPDGHVQGGLLSALADGGQSLALMSTQTEFEVWVTLDLHTRFVRPIKAGTAIRIESIVSKTKTSATAETAFTLPDGKLAAKVTGGWRKIETGRAENFEPPA